MAANPKDPPRHLYTLDEYFALEQVGDARYEYWDGDLVCMSGGSEQHARIGGNIYFMLRQQLTGGRCETFTADLPVKTPRLPPYRYPDVSVACDKAEFEKIQGIDALTNPTLIVEVLSPGTESRDRLDKRLAYQSLPSLLEYLLIAQDTPHLTHYLRQGEVWVRSDYAGLDLQIPLPAINCVLAMREVYLGIEFQ